VVDCSQIVEQIGMTQASTIGLQIDEEDLGEVGIGEGLFIARETVTEHPDEPHGRIGSGLVMSGAVRLNEYAAKEARGLLVTPQSVGTSCDQEHPLQLQRSELQWVCPCDHVARECLGLLVAACGPKPASLLQRANELGGSDPSCGIGRQRGSTPEHDGIGACFDPRQSGHGRNRSRYAAFSAVDENVDQRREAFASFFQTVDGVPVEVRVERPLHLGSNACFGSRRAPARDVRVDLPRGHAVRRLTVRHTIPGQAAV
jgi:hypothetical protein